MHSPTPEQSAILDFVATRPENLMIRALAGTGKSATLLMIDQASQGPCLYLVFNTANAKEATKEFKSSTLVKTFNSIGHRVWANTCAHKIVLSKTKILDIFRAIATEAPRPHAKEMWKVYDSVKAGVDMARNLGYIPANHAKASASLCEDWDVWEAMDETPSPLAKELIGEILLESIRQSYRGCVDFTDQCYMAGLFGGVYPRFPLVLVDEYQDLNPVQHHLLTKLCKHSRQIGVGDDAQSIYQFRGAVVGGMSSAVDRFGMETMGLTVSFRCPSAIVNNVKWRVPDFKASREGGSVTHGRAIDDHSTVICRNNAPLLGQAMMMLYNGRSVNVAGVDIAKSLLHQMAKLGPEDMPRATALDAVESWEAAREAAGSKTGKDMAGCMRVFLQRAKTLGGAIAIAKHAFEQSGTVSFVTGHKAKGLEWDRVYHLEPKLCRDEGQDPNIRYVIDTRSRDQLIYLS